MRISLNWLNQLVDIETANLEYLLEKLTLGGFEVEEFLELKIGHETHGFEGCMTGFLFNQLAPLKTDQWRQEMLKPCGGPRELLRKMTREANSNVTGLIIFYTRHT